MNIVKPRVFFVAETRVLESDAGEIKEGMCSPPCEGTDVEIGLDRYLDAVGASEWKTDAPSDPEKLVEVMGRLCYRSFVAGLNANVTKIREGNDTYLGHIVGVGHGSVIEHSMVSFIFHHVSRVFTHELVRHRAGTAISQESLRFVRLDHLDFWLPDWVKKDPELTAMFLAKIKADEDFQIALAKKFDLDHEKKFEVKKFKTSFMRRAAPDGLATSIGWSCNLRSLRHILEMRTALSSEEEIRLVFGMVGRFAKVRWPNLFADYVENDAGEFVTEHRKV